MGPAASAPLYIDTDASPAFDQSGDEQTVATLAGLPPGKFLLSATLSVTDTANDGNRHIMTCTLASGGDGYIEQNTLFDYTKQLGFTIDLEHAIAIKAPLATRRATVSCRTDAGVAVTVQNVTLTAMRVDAVVTSGS